MLPDSRLRRIKIDLIKAFSIPIISIKGSFGTILNNY